MSILVATISKEKSPVLDRIIHSNLFTKVYLIGDKFDVQNFVKPVVNGVTIELVSVDFTNAVEDVVGQLYLVLKQKFSSDKILELDIAVNISSGSGKEHAIVISTLMKLGYGIRLIELDKNNTILEMI